MFFQNHGRDVVIQDGPIKKNHFQPIAIVGMGALFAGSRNLAEFWENGDLKKDTIMAWIAIGAGGHAPTMIVKWLV